MAKFALGKESIRNTLSVEYEWVRKMDADKHSQKEIIQNIQVCLGGDKQVARLFYDVAMYRAPHESLINHLDIK